MTYFIYLLYTVVNGHMVCILFKLTFVFTCPLNIRTLFMAWNVFSCWFLVNKRTPRLETILCTFLALFPATVINKSTTVGQLVTNSLWAVSQLNLSIFADLSTEFLFTHKFVISCLIVVLIQLTSSFVTSGICNSWLMAVLYCHILYGWSWSVFICQYRHLLNSRIITLKTIFVCNCNDWKDGSTVCAIVPFIKKMARNFNLQRILKNSPFKIWKKKCWK